jgi:hypothetical protein
MTPDLTYFLAAVFGLLAMLLLVWRPGPKWWIGVRLPWTFADREIWNTSWVIAGLFCLVIAVAVLISAIAFYSALALFFIVSMVYPLYLYRRKYGTLQFWKEVGWVDYRPVVRCLHCGHLQKLRDAAQLTVTTCEACGLFCRKQNREDRFP